MGAIIVGLVPRVRYDLRSAHYGPIPRRKRKATNEIQTRNRLFCFAMFFAKMPLEDSCPGRSKKDGRAFSFADDKYFYSSQKPIIRIPDARRIEYGDKMVTYCSLKRERRRSLPLPRTPYGELQSEQGTGVKAMPSRTGKASRALIV